MPRLLEGSRSAAGRRPQAANGIEFNNEGTGLFALNTAYNSIVKIPVKANGSGGTGVTFTTGLNGRDGLAVDANDNLWVAANQGDEIAVVDPSGRVVAKKGDFNGVASDGSIQGLYVLGPPAWCLRFGR